MLQHQFPCFVLYLQQFSLLLQHHLHSIKGISKTFPNCPRLLPVKILLLRMLSGKASTPMPILVLGFSTSNIVEALAREYQFPPNRATRSSLRWSIFPASFNIFSSICTSRISAITKLPAPPLSPNGFTSITLHSTGVCALGA